MNIVSLSEHLGLSRLTLEEHGILDITLGIDTQYFIEPLLLDKCEIEEFKDSRQKNLDYFSRLIRMIKASEHSSQMRAKALEMLAIKEPKGLSIGYGGKGDGGTSISLTVAKSIIKNILEILRIGIDDPEIIEILCLFVEGYGSDSISDLTAHILYENFCTYTERKAKELGVDTTRFDIKGKEYHLPKHPFNGDQVIFIPNTIISPLPVANDWDGVIEAAQFNQKMRERISEILFPTLHNDIISSSQRTPEEVEKIKQRLEALIETYKDTPVETYSLDSDPAGYYKLNQEVEKNKQAIQQQPKPQNNEELLERIQQLLIQFQKAIVDNGANKLLYKPDGKPHREEISQILFYMLADYFCSQNDILLSRESNSGRGPVDFSLGTGYTSKVIVEIKKSSNNNLLSGFQKQVEAYARGEAAFHSYYLVLVVKNRKRDDQLSLVEDAYNKAISEGADCPELLIIDALVYPSPSKL